MSIPSFIAANRFGLGLRPDGADGPGNDPRGWVESQLAVAATTAIPTYNLPDPVTLTQQTFTLLAQKRMDKDDPDAKKDDHHELRDLTLSGYAGRLQANLTGLPLLERLTLFWSNHFTVSTKGKGFIGPLACGMERDAIRPHLTGKFEDMLKAVAKHPAMLIYLDNATSIGPNSPAGQRRKAGLNENYAREVMELHTLGAQGGYSQADVTTLAAILTGWTLDKPQKGGTGQFLFMENLHEPGPKTVMGKSYDGTGQQQGEEALHDLATHPSTAHFIATKLVRHFVADDPPLDDVERVADAFNRSGGDLGATTEAVITLDNVWRQPLPKVKTPYEMILSALRATGVQADALPYPKIHGALQLLGQPPFAAPSPAGWSDRADDWIAAEAVMNRVELCHTIAQKMTPPDANIQQLADLLIGPVASADTMTAIKRAPSPADGFALVLASPEFQRR